jgi:hypothetical protein
LKRGGTVDLDDQLSEDEKLVRDSAQTMQMSATGLFVIQVLVPVSRYPHLACSALVRMACGSDPASGSVRPKQPIHSPVARFGKYLRRRASLP